MANTNRQITVKGDFQRAVIINDTLVNGKDCVYDFGDTPTYSHAEGNKSEATGLYSHAEGNIAKTIHERSYVWSGSSGNENTEPKVSKGAGTFALYTNSYVSESQPASADGLQQVFINGVTIANIAEEYKQKAINAIRTENNTFTGNLTINGSSSTPTVLTIGSNSSLTNNGKSSFVDRASFAGFAGKTDSSGDLAITRNDNQFATCKFVHSVVQEYLKNIFGTGIFKST